MADVVDQAQERQEQIEALALNKPRYELPKGLAGECKKCGEESPRLIGGACAPCRDKFKLL